MTGSRGAGLGRGRASFPWVRWCHRRRGMARSACGARCHAGRTRRPTIPNARALPPLLTAGTRWGTAGEAAADRGTCVCAHVHTPTGTLRCIKAGVKSIGHGQRGVITAGALADILVWDGDLEGDLELIGNPDTNLRLVMQGGHIFKEELA